MSKLTASFRIFFVASLAVFVALAFGFIPINGTADEVSEVSPFVDVSARKRALAELPKRERLKYCANNFSGIVMKREATITGAIQRQQSNVQMAGHSLFQSVERYFSDDEFAAADIRDALEEAVRINAFSDVKPYRPKEYPNYNKFNEPYFQLAVFLTPLAHAYLVMKAEYPNDIQFLESLRLWGDSLYKITVNGKNDFKGKVKGIDRRALHAMGYAHWGNATENPEVLKTAYKYYKKALRCVGKKGKDRVWRHWAKKKDHVYYPNMTYQATLAAAFALHRSGYDDVYVMAPKKGTIVDGMVWLWDAVFDRNQFQLKKLRGSGSRTIAWAEIFVHEFPEHPHAEKMRTWIAQKNRPVYGAFAGGPVSCLYRQIN